jgi:hypothetical protein
MSTLGLQWEKGRDGPLSASLAKREWVDRALNVCPNPAVGLRYLGPAQPPLTLPSSYGIGLRAALTMLPPDLEALPPLHRLVSRQHMRPSNVSTIRYCIAKQPVRSYTRVLLYTVQPLEATGSVACFFCALVGTHLQVVLAV